MPADQLAAQAMSLLIEVMRDPSTPAQHILMSPSISLRHSTGAAPVRPRGTVPPSIAKPF
jgi:DNA-binding LacI/PurR family transcriptional regulator